MRSNTSSASSEARQDGDRDTTTGELGNKGDAGYVEFPTPPGFSAPESPNGDGVFEAVCTFQSKDGGKTLCMTQLGDTVLGKPKDERATEQEPDYKAMAKSMVPSSDSGGY